MKLIRAAAVIDAEAVYAAPGVLLLRGDTVVAAGAPESIGAVAEAEVVELPSSVLLPGMVNAHAHLDLSRLTPRPFSGKFDSWLEGVRDCRVDQTDATRRSDTQQGITLSLAGGTAFVGDISGSGFVEPLEVLRKSPLGGTSFVEFFGLGNMQEKNVEAMHAVLESISPEAEGVRLGISPHAPYSCGPQMYEAALETDLPVVTHLAESLEEEEVLRTESGPFRDLAERYKVWNEATTMPGCHPVDALKDVLKRRPIVVVHMNYIEEEHVGLVAQTNTRVVYCPRASDYFGHPHGGRPQHRYLDLLESGATVALGTDSLCCLDTPDRIGVLDEMRHLSVRDGSDPRQLLSMATVHGARVLEIDERLVQFTPGAVGGVLSVELEGDHRGDPLAAVMRQRNAPSWLQAPRSDD